MNSTMINKLGTCLSTAGDILTMLVVFDGEFWRGAERWVQSRSAKSKAHFANHLKSLHKMIIGIVLFFLICLILPSWLQKITNTPQKNIEPPLNTNTKRTHLRKIKDGFTRLRSQTSNLTLVVMVCCFVVYLGCVDKYLSFGDAASTYVIHKFDKEGSLRTIVAGWATALSFIGEKLKGL